MSNLQISPTMPETSAPDNKMGDVSTHVEIAPDAQPAPVDTGLVLDDHAVTLDSDELRDQMAAQIKSTKLSITSKASMQLWFYLFVAYCSKLPTVKAYSRLLAY